MSSHLDFYFDFSSPYGYFASTKINDLAQQFGRRVDWHPFSSDTLRPSNTGTSLVQIPAKREYIMKDYVRSAKFLNIPFKVPTVFPLDTRIATRAVMWTEAKFGEDKGILFAQTVFKAYYVDDKNIGDPEAIISLGESIGINPQELREGMSSTYTKEQVRAEIDLAAAKGVFGSPFILLDGESFWGVDRLDQLEAALKAKQTA
jgi:2-hydroxychromene-2-carboxylate isomerase